MVSLRMGDACGFDALCMTGFGTVASHLGLPDAGLATCTDRVGRVRPMAGMARTPLIADGDTGYGGLLNVQHTVQGYEAAGAQAIQLEDQEVPKKCGRTPGRRVVPMADMVKKIEVAVASRRSPSLPDVPTFAEAGVPDLVVDSWVGILAPAATPPAVLARLNAELNAVLNDPVVRERLATLGIEPTPGTAGQFRQAMQRDLAAYGPIVKNAGIKIE